MLDISEALTTDEEKGQRKTYRSIEMYFMLNFVAVVC